MIPQQARSPLLQQNVGQMGRKRVHGGQFSRLNQPSVKKKKEITNENVKKRAPSSVRVELKNLLSEKKIDKLEWDCKRLQCENAGLKRTIQTLRRSIGKCLLKYSSSRLSHKHKKIRGDAN